MVTVASDPLTLAGVRLKVLSPCSRDRLVGCDAPLVPGIQVEGLDSESAAGSLADALEELHRLQRSLDRRIRRDQARPEGPYS
jgi:hypothetical protein